MAAQERDDTERGGAAGCGAQETATEMVKEEATRAQAEYKP
eukprot:CAMPEP_0175126276 /NCGR_PEP_ID=MMETSP0087-20121206/3759_1 /TAXON_ID=136419 /ORGANISM="Unknown Unknown, Strain D1" /LENGTH=40 /DNA_ID= /DNA_START= /DNA_END= /DNA_ORIENTATION=